MKRGPRVQLAEFGNCAIVVCEQWPQLEKSEVTRILVEASSRIDVSNSET